MEVSSTSSTRHRRLRRWATSVTSAFTDGQLTPCSSPDQTNRRTRAPRAIGFAAAAHERSTPVVLSRTERSRVSCTLWHLNPQCQRGRLTVDSTRTLNSGVSTTTGARGSGVGSHGALGSLDVNHRFSRAPTPQRGPSTTPLPTFTRRLHKWVDSLYEWLQSPQVTEDAETSLLPPGSSARELVEYVVQVGAPVDREAAARALKLLPADSRPPNVQEARDAQAALVGSPVVKAWKALDDLTTNP